MKLETFPRLGTAILVVSWIGLSTTRVEGTSSADFGALSKKADQNYSTTEGRRYSEQFQRAIRKVFIPAFGRCAITLRETKEPAEFIFVVAANGSVKRLLYSDNNPLGECVGSKLREIKLLPRPPQDGWVVALAATNNPQHLPQEKSKAPPDRPLRISSEEKLAAYQKAAAPYISKARDTYPAAKKRFLAGLPQGYKFFVRLPLIDPTGVTENSFVRVEKIEHGIITGLIDSKLEAVSQYKTGQRTSFPEGRIDNWLILRPDGTEEGNYVGKFLDHYKPE